MPVKYDMAVIGGGPGGYVSAIRGRQLGLNVALIEKEKIGGVCLNRGCIPTKALLSDIEGLHWASRAARDQIIREIPEIDFSRLMNRKNTAVQAIVSNLEKHLDGLGVRIFCANGKIMDPETITTDTGEVLKTKNIVLATGSRSWTPPLEGAELPGVLHTRQILELDKLPKQLVIIGGGIVGQEFAAIFAGLGSQVTVLEVLDRILLGVDQELARKYASFLPVKGISTELGAQIKRIERFGERLQILYERKGKEKVTQADLVLMAAGRRPFFADSGVDEIGADIRNGCVVVDEFLRTSLKGIYAVGDVLGRNMLAHAASFQGEIAAENIAGKQRSTNNDVVPACVFTIPQIAWAGLTEEEAQTSGRAYRTSTFSLFSSGKAVAMGEARGWLKLVEDSESKRLIGAHFMGPDVSELIAMMTFAIQKGLTASDLADVMFPHPTISEAIREAALGFLDGPIHAAARTKSSRN